MQWAAAYGWSLNCRQKEQKYSVRTVRISLSHRKLVTMQLSAFCCIIFYLIWRCTQKETYFFFGVNLHSRKTHNILAWLGCSCIWGMPSILYALCPVQVNQLPLFWIIVSLLEDHMNSKAAVLYCRAQQCITRLASLFRNPQTNKCLSWHGRSQGKCICVLSASIFHIKLWISISDQKLNPKYISSSVAVLWIL